MSIELIVIAVALVIAAVVGKRLSRRVRRRSLRARPTPESWNEILRRNVPVDAKLPEPLRAELRQDIAVFLDEKNFEGCLGLELTEEIRVTIAAYACLLLLNRPKSYYPGLASILVYPAAFQIPERDIVALGESSRLGAVALSWDDTLRGARDPRDAHNVALHEFAHQLDQADGVADGTPILGRRGDYGVWARVLGEEFIELREDVQAGRKSLLRDYGATNEAEFFAVATEVFFEKPGPLKRRHPELYRELAAFYNQDPASY